MAIASFQDFCIDTGGDEALGRFWASVLGVEFVPDGQAGVLKGATPEQRVWMNVVPEPKTAKHRLHLDVHCASVEELEALGAKVLEPKTGQRRWTVMADPEGGEFCAFVREPANLPSYRLYEFVLDCADPKLVAGWWAGVLGAELGGDDEKGWYWLEDVPGLPFEGWSFVPVPEPKTVKNRIHLDVNVDSIGDLVKAGAVVLRDPTDEDEWTVMADPEGNEFCAFVRAS